MNYWKEQQQIKAEKKRAFAIQCLVLVGMLMATVWVMGNSFDAGFESRCDVWGNPSVCNEK